MMMKFAMLLISSIVCESMQITDASSTSGEKLNAHLVCGSFSHPDGTVGHRITIAPGKFNCVGQTCSPGLTGSKVNFQSK